MNTDERKVIAFLLGIIFKLSLNQAISLNELQQIDNLMGDFGTYDLDENEFRY